MKACNPAILMESWWNERCRVREGERCKLDGIDFGSLHQHLFDQLSKLKEEGLQCTSRPGKTPAADVLKLNYDVAFSDCLISGGGRKKSKVWRNRQHI